MESVRVLALMCMSNVDGSGRKNHHHRPHRRHQVRGRLLCRITGEFCDGALSEGKKRYAKVKCAQRLETLADVASEEGIDGGWSD